MYFIRSLSKLIISSHFGTLNTISVIGNSNNIFSKILLMSSSFNLRQFIAIVDTSYLLSIVFFNSRHSFDVGSIELTRIIKGLLIFFNSLTVLSNALL